MLTLIEKLLFIVAVGASLYYTWLGVQRIIAIIARGQGQPDWKLARQRLADALLKTIALKPTWRLRPGATLFHALVAWGFMYYALVNIGDVLQGYLPNFTFLGHGLLGNVYRLGADLLSAGVLVGMSALLVRRFLLRPAELVAREDIFLNPKARAGIRRDSAIVGVFILLHVGGRFLGQSFQIAGHGGADGWQPFASLVAALWRNWSETALTVGEHITFWLALGLILAFLPYFPKSKHIHLFFAPLNFLLKPQRRSIGELSKLDFDDESIEQFGATHLEDLGWEQLMDGYACIMCSRCQQVCPAYNTGKALSPAALEINKRYLFNYAQGDALAAGQATETPLVELLLPAEAVWACTACGACVDICPVGNEPMRDILDIRRSLVLMDNEFPSELQTAFRGMERTANPWNISPAERLKWAEGLDVPTIEENPDPEILWWVGCAPATDARAQKTARAFARILQAAGVSFAVLGEQEQCTGDAARRAGNEYLFNELATGNVEILNEVAPKRIVATCPHCLHTLKNEYPAFGGHYDVVHHTQLIQELLQSGRLKLQPQTAQKVTLHDPCYLGRHNGILEAPRFVLQQSGAALAEMPRHGRLSFCCGAGGAQMWKEEEEGSARVNLTRFAEANQTGADTLAVGCPFCLTMMTDASREAASQMQVKDIAEIIAETLPEA
ncbi:MAG: (Fe-S)-binding protein [Anaerolineales bacterium]